MSTKMEKMNLKERVMSWYDSLNSDEDGMRTQAFLSTNAFPPLPPFCPHLPEYLGRYLRPQLFGPYAELPEDIEVLQECDGEHRALVWLVAYFTEGEVPFLQLHLTEPAHSKETRLSFSKDGQELTVSMLSQHTPLMHPPLDEEGKDPEDEEEYDYDDDDDERLKWTGTTPTTMTFPSADVLVWALLPCGTETFREIFPKTIKLKTGDLLYHGSYDDPEKFSWLADNLRGQMWFSHIPFPELARLGGDYRTKDGITWCRPYVYEFKVQEDCSLKLLDLTHIDDTRVHVTTGISAMIEQCERAGGMALRLARMTGTTVEAKLMARPLIDELFTGRLPIQWTDKTLPEWLPVQTPAATGNVEDWDAEALSTLPWRHLNGWYGCDYTQTSSQREVVLWRGAASKKLYYVGHTEFVSKADKRRKRSFNNGGSGKSKNTATTNTKRKKRLAKKRKTHK